MSFNFDIHNNACVPLCQRRKVFHHQIAKDIGIRKQECDEEQIAFDYHYESMGGSRHTGTPRTPTPPGRCTRNRLLQDTLEICCFQIPPLDGVAVSNLKY